ncbi:hypothetical protein C7450_103104 [Chelatococcus asaccharovorans]|uniref:DUF7736 domain-containing protein n=1 Tax=Chelatococcus asaccharovorans TaxID=28210 RepID=A0A2V3UAX7_9HYPH|nr:hypothetical protein C7450_103104 [Chelatococcus asaccharovorans]
MTTSEAKTFLLADVLSCSTGFLMGGIDGVYRVAEFLSGGPVWTHQLVRLCPLSADYFSNSNGSTSTDYCGRNCTRTETDEIATTRGLRTDHSGQAD